jgi:hypothetical protein
MALGLVAAASGDDSESSGGDDEPSDTSLETGTMGDDDEATAEYGGTVTIGMESETNSWSPEIGQFAASGYTVAYSFYDPPASNRVP